MQQYYTTHDVADINQLAQEALELKKAPLAHSTLGQGKTLGLIFLNPSLRTRLSTQKAAQLLGMHCIVLEINKEGWKLETEPGVVMDGSKAEHIKEAAPVIGQYCDVIGIRAFPKLQNRADDYRDWVLQSFIELSGRPVINLESALFHPFQALTDLITIRELQTQAKPKVVLTWAPHPGKLPMAVPNSFARCMLHAGVDFTVTHPEGYHLDPDLVPGYQYELDPKKAYEGADFVYAKNWSSLSDYGTNPLGHDTSWMVDEAKMALTNQAKFMHCLPVRRNVVVSDAVIDSPNSVVVQQAGNRTYAAQVVLKKILEAMQ